MRGGRGGREACAQRPGFCDVGSTNLAGAACFAAGCRVLGGTGPRTATLSLEVEGLGLGKAEAQFARAGIVVRAGQHCAPLALEALGEPEGTLRISFGPFNTPGDVDQILAAIDAARTSAQ